MTTKNQTEQFTMSEELELRERIRQIIAEELEAVRAFEIPLVQLHVHFYEPVKIHRLQAMVNDFSTDLWVSRITEQLRQSGI